MSATPLFIPKKLKIGFQNRNDTHTGKLAYVIYYDERNKLRKEASWNSWCDKKIPSIEIDNSPNGGYVLNKGVRRYSDWGSGRSVIRIWDPRDFEFEISVDNLIGLLQHSDVSSGEIFEKCVFAWKGADLVLLPCNSEQYAQSVDFTAIQDGKLSTKALVPGMVYPKKKTSRETYTYIGFYDWFEYKEKYVVLTNGTRMTVDEAKDKWGYGFVYSSNYNSSVPKEFKIEYGSVAKGRKHVFLNNIDKKFECVSVASLSPTVVDDQTENIANLIERFNNTIHSSEVIGFEVITPTCYATRFDNKLWKISGDQVLMLDTRIRGKYRYDNTPALDTVTMVEARTFRFIDGDALNETYNDVRNNGYYSRRTIKVQNKENFSVSPTAYKKTDQGYYEEFVLRPEGAKELFDTHGFGVLQYKLKNGNKSVAIY